MGIFTKSCSFCGTSVFMLGGHSLKDGCYCKHCKSKLSPFFIHQNTLTVNDIRNQLQKRAMNEQVFSQFNTTGSLGNFPKLLIDENSNQFVVLLAPHTKGCPTPDVISFSELVDCSIEIKESKTEVKYKDYNDNLKSFVPPYYAYSYDFFVNISLNIPYIPMIKFKINEKPVDNDQPHVIGKTGGLGQMFRDALGSSRSFNGLTSNIIEVQSSIAYRKYDSLANDMRNALIAAKISSQQKKSTFRCPWCDCIVIDNSSGVCEHCCGQL